MKAAPVMSAIATAGLPQLLIHTGQHYDQAMSSKLFDQLGLPQPNVNLNVGSGSHAQQTAAIMVGLEQFLTSTDVALMVLYGDVNSTLAGAVTGAKMQIPLAHVEAGVRSFDRSMPEEINRVVTDRLSQYLLTPSEEAGENLLREGADPSSIHCVGNVLTDSLVRCLPLADAESVLTPLGLTPSDPFILTTLHRVSTVDDPTVLEAMIKALSQLASRCPVVFPVHPRTRARIDPSWLVHQNLKLIEPSGYLQFLGLEQHARLVITDSGGIQVETSYLGVPCVTVRENTEWPETIRIGTNTLVGRDSARLVAAAHEALDRPRGPRVVPEIWDGRAAERVAEVVAKAYRESPPA
jgi:UDP-N-acetylglucosamine 2-epimerase (non-hydrolysing)